MLHSADEVPRRNVTNSGYNDRLPATECNRFRPLCSTIQYGGSWGSAESP